MTYQAGGRVTITMGGVRYSPRGAVTIDGAGIENSVIANHDDTISVTTANTAVTAQFSFDRGTASSNTARPKWDKTFMSGTYDVTVHEIDTNVLHMFSQARITGKPVLDTATGEVTGLSIAVQSSAYVQTTA
jgi:hypothetical protein